MKDLMKFTLVLCLFGSVAFADGDMGGGNNQCPPEGCPPPPCTENCLMAVRPVDDGTETTVGTIFTDTEVIIDLVNETLGLY